MSSAQFPLARAAFARYAARCEGTNSRSIAKTIEKPPILVRDDPSQKDSVTSYFSRIWHNLSVVIMSRRTRRKPTKRLPTSHSNQMD